MTECCASGKCEVCSPSFFGNDTPTRDSKGNLPLDDARCTSCGGKLTLDFKRLPWGFYCSPGCLP